MVKCAVPGCKRKSRGFLMGFLVGREKRFGLVCGTHDRVIGRQNLIAIGIPLEQAIQFERKIEDQ